MNVEVRRWTPDDLPAIREVFGTTWKSAYGSFIPEEDIRSHLDHYYSVGELTRLIASEEVAGFVGTADSVVVGALKISVDAARGRLSVGSLYILPEFQGMGLGRKLMQTAAREARARGYDEVWLGVMEQNTSALTWYQKMGYEIHETTPFVMGSTTVRHHIGFVPVSRLLDQKHSASV